MFCSPDLWRLLLNMNQFACGLGIVYTFLAPSAVKFDEIGCDVFKKVVLYIRAEPSLARLDQLGEATATDEDSRVCHLRRPSSVRGKRGTKRWSIHASLGRSIDR